LNLLLMKMMNFLNYNRNLVLSFVVQPGKTSVQNFWMVTRNPMNFFQNLE
jgi:hypothetical protein